jgi:hypothetical protein
MKLCHFQHCLHQVHFAGSTTIGQVAGRKLWDRKILVNNQMQTSFISKVSSRLSAYSVRAFGAPWRSFAAN